MPQVVWDPQELSVGSHSLCLYADAAEAAEKEARYLAGTPDGLFATFLVSGPARADAAMAQLRHAAPRLVLALQQFEGEHVEAVDGRLRPVRAIRELLAAHPEGVSAGADTFSSHWGPESVEAHLEYEQWFDGQARERSRFLCAYDLARIPAASLAETLDSLGRHHSHVVLSGSSEPAVRFAQLLAFGTPARVPVRLRENLLWAIEERYLRTLGPHDPLVVAVRGRDCFSEWASRATKLPAA